MSFTSGKFFLSQLTNRKLTSIQLFSVVRVHAHFPIVFVKLEAAGDFGIRRLPVIFEGQEFQLPVEACIAQVDLQIVQVPDWPRSHRPHCRYPA